MGSVLVVDDDEMILAIVRSALEREGISVTTAVDGAEALDRLALDLPNLVISDVNMPEVDGLELLRRVRATPRTRAVPVLLLTTRSETGDVVEGLALGADDYLTKPFAVPELLARVRAKLERPPLPADDLPVDSATGLLGASRFRDEVTRELLRSARGGRPGVVGVLELAELAGVELRLGRAAADDALGKVAEVLHGVLRPLDAVARLDDVHVGVLMPETTPEDAAKRLEVASTHVSRATIRVAGEGLRATPSVGLASFADGGTSSQLEERAGVALEYARSHLDLMPRRWDPSMDAVVAQQRLIEAAAAGGPSRRQTLWLRMRTPFQIALTFVLGVILPFFAYWGLDEVGLDITWPMYLLVVASLAVTGILIWMEGLQSMRVEEPPEQPGEAYPPASAIIAAYLPNEAATVLETIEAFLRLDYPEPIQVILAYNTPNPMAIEAVLAEYQEQHPGFVAHKVEGSTSKAQNVNAALALATGRFVGVFDADHQPDPDSFTRAWRWLANGYDVVQGHCLVRNGAVSKVARTVAVEFEAIYAVSHPGRARLHDFGIFGGSNGYWRTDLLHEIRMRGSMLTEDIDSSLRVIEGGGRIRSDPRLVSRELATTTWQQVWNQRMRWAQGWFQVSMSHLPQAMRSKHLTVRQKLGLFHLLGWREVYPWLSLQMFPIVAYWLFRDDPIDWVVPIFVVTSLFTLSVGPFQAWFAYRRADPEIRQHRRWFWRYLLVSSIYYTEYKNIIARVAQVKELMGEVDWRVTPRSSS
jgi:CheY-like chemotaxis protein/cellulose synthase/poly-beta-1,6-N-acetylglucosamine synthase-like glycosyltransferase